MNVKFEVKTTAFISKPVTKLTLKEGNGIVTFVTTGNPTEAMAEFISKARAGVCYELLEVEFNKPQGVND